MKTLCVLMSALVLGYIIVFSLTKLNNESNGDIKFYLSSLLLSLLMFAGEVYIPPYIKPFLMIGTTYFIDAIIYRNKVNIALIDSLYIVIMCMISETIFAIMFYLLFSRLSVNDISSNPEILLMSNIFIGALFYLISDTKMFKKIRKRFINNIGLFAKYKLLFFINLFFIMILSLFYFVYYKSATDINLSMYLVIVMMFLFYTFISLLIIYYINRYNTIQNKYTLSLENLKEYEDMINKYRISIHENKNELLIIRNMGNYKDAKKYIDTLINNKEKYDMDISSKVSRIPCNYLRTVIYNKMVQMDKCDVNSELIVSKNVKAQNFLSLDDKTVLDICNITNVFLDNAIDASVGLKNKNVLIEVSVEDNQILIDISNSYKNKINLKQIDRPGYTTKGGNHGYGLSLVKNIIKENSLLNNVCEKTSTTFTQILKIKM